MFFTELKKDNLKRFKLKGPAILPAFFAPYENSAPRGTILMNLLVLSYCYW